jgi:hypothetical protein
MSQTPVPEPDSLDDITDALVELMRTGTRPEVLDAQRVLLMRLATQGDVLPSRVPPPRNVTEVGGYLNLLATDGHVDLRIGAVAAALGLAAPPPEAVGGTAVAVGFVAVANDRPDGPARAGIPATVDVRADLVAPLQQALGSLRAQGCAVPLRSTRPSLPVTGALPSGAARDTALLAVLGRRLTVWPAAVLADPAVDPLAVARHENPPTDPFRLLARVLDGSTTVAEADWVAVRCSASACTTDAPATRRYVEVAPALSDAGWEHPTPFAAPTTASDTGTLTAWHNVTGLVPGETTLGDELALLYTPAQVARSALASLTAAVWDGTRFADV